MNTITNKKEYYQSRSKITSQFSNNHAAKKDEKITRENYKVDCNGYFIWNSGGDLKKYNKEHLGTDLICAPACPRA